MKMVRIVIANNNGQYFFYHILAGCSLTLSHHLDMNYTLAPEDCLQQRFVSLNDLQDQYSEMRIRLDTRNLVIWLGIIVYVLNTLCKEME